MESLKNKNIIVGVTGGIACYKTCDLVRLLTAQKAQVTVVMTPGATQFVTPMTFQALSQNTVYTELFDLTQESEMGHIRLADNADLVVVAPTTADFLARVAHGFCDTLLSTVICVTQSPVLFAPAMNVHMYENPLVQSNIHKLTSLGYHFIGPATGSLACGYEGLGRLVEPSMILENISDLLHASPKK